MPRILRLSCRALLILVLVTPNFYSAQLAGWFGCFSCLSTLSPEELQTAKTLVDSYPSDLDNSFVDELCHFAMFADIFKDDEPCRRYQHWAMGSIQMSMRNSIHILFCNCGVVAMWYFCVLALGSGHASSVSVRVRVRVSVSFSFGVTPLRILICVCPLSYFCTNWLLIIINRQFLTRRNMEPHHPLQGRVIQQALLIFAYLYPTFGKVGYKKIMFCTPTLKSAAAPWPWAWRDLHFSFYSLPSTIKLGPRPPTS